MDINFASPLGSSVWDSNFVAGIAGALLGAIVGGAISWALQSTAFARENRQKMLETQSSNRQLAHSLAFKTHLIFEQFGMIASHFKDEASKMPTGAPHPFRFIQPMINVFDEIRFNYEELGLLLSKDAPLANELMLLQQRHNTRLRALASYNQMRLAVAAEMPATEKQGNVATSEFTGEEMARLVPRWLMLDSLVLNFIECASDEHAAARTALKAVSEAIETHFHARFRLEFQDEASEPPTA